MKKIDIFIEKANVLKVGIAKNYKWAFDESEEHKNSLEVKLLLKELCRFLSHGIEEAEALNNIESTGRLLKCKFCEHPMMIIEKHTSIEEGESNLSRKFTLETVDLFFMKKDIGNIDNRKCNKCGEPSAMKPCTKEEYVDSKINEFWSAAYTIWDDIAKFLPDED